MSNKSETQPIVSNEGGSSQQPQVNQWQLQLQRKKGKLCQTIKEVWCMETLHKIYKWEKWEKM